jgi:hypothetical protein
MCTNAWPIQVRPSLQWKTRPGFRPVSLSLSMLDVKFVEQTLDILTLCHYSEFCVLHIVRVNVVIVSRVKQAKKNL